MQRNISQYLQPIFDHAKKMRQHKVAKMAAPSVDPTAVIPPEFNGRDYVSFLLHIDAELEHGLMVMYLYAAYSMGGPQVPDHLRDQVRGWQEIILGIAKEEMGHFISVENVLRLIGAPLNFGRQDYPWDTPFYPFPFRLEPLTLDSLAKYVYAEAPEEFITSDDPIAQEIVARVNAEVEDPQRVGALFDILLQLLKNPAVIPNSAFQANTFPFQATFAEWGRGYQGGSRGDSMGANPKGAPDVLVEAGSSRDDAVTAVEMIAEQGESPNHGPDEDPSHFERFLKVYIEMRAAILEMESAGQPGWLPSRPIAVNPYIGSAEDANNDPAEGMGSDQERDAIENPVAQQWGHLLNIRYRMLLTYLTHSFSLRNGFTDDNSRTARGAIINSTFGEMYNLRAISFKMIQLPLNDSGEGKLAGPPFKIPYSLDLPTGEQNRWNLHRDLILASEPIIQRLLKMSPGEAKYLHGLREADRKFLQIIDQLVAETA